MVGNEQVSLTFSADAVAYSHKNAGTTAQNLTIKDASKLQLSGADVDNYTFSYANGDRIVGMTGIIDKRNLTVSATVATSRVYNRSTAIAVSTPYCYRLGFWGGKNIRRIKSIRHIDSGGV